MDNIFSMVGLVLALGLIGWLIAIEFRLSNLRAELYRERSKTQDEQVIKKTHDLSNAELDALVSKSIGPDGRKDS